MLNTKKLVAFSPFKIQSKYFTLWYMTLFLKQKDSGELKDFSCVTNKFKNRTHQMQKSIVIFTVVLLCVFSGRDFRCTVLQIQYMYIYYFTIKYWSVLYKNDTLIISNDLWEMITISLSLLTLYYIWTSLYVVLFC